MGSPELSPHENKKVKDFITITKPTNYQKSTLSNCKEIESHSLDLKHSFKDSNMGQTFESEQHNEKNEISLVLEAYPNETRRVNPDINNDHFAINDISLTNNVKVESAGMDKKCINMVEKKIELDKNEGHLRKNTNGADIDTTNKDEHIVTTISPEGFAVNIDYEKLLKHEMMKRMLVERLVAEHDLTIKQLEKEKSQAINDMKNAEGIFLDQSNERELEIASLETVKLKITSDINNTASQLKGLKQENDEVMSKMSILCSKVEDINKEKENLLQQNNRLELTIDKLQESIEVLNDLTKEKEELNTKIIILRSELDDKTYQCDERKACIDELMMKQNVREKRDLKLAEINATAIEALSREKKRLRDSNGSLKSELTNANNSLKELEDLLATKEEEKNTVLSEKTLLLSKCAKFDQGSSLMEKKMVTYRLEKEGFKNLKINNSNLHVKNKILAEEKKSLTEKNDELNSKIDRFEKLLKKKDNELIVLEDNQHKTLSKEALTQSRFIKLGKQLRIAEEELVSFKNLNKKSLVKYNVLSEENKLFDANIHVLQSELDHANESLKEVKDAVIMKDEEMKKIGNVCDRNKTLIEEKESLELRLESLEFDREELLVQLGLFRQTQEESHTMYESVITKMQEDNDDKETLCHELKTKLEEEEETTVNNEMNALKEFALKNEAISKLAEKN